MFNLINLFNTIVYKKRYITMDENDMMDVLAMISEIKNNSEFHQSMKMDFGRYGRSGNIVKSYIYYKATNNQWNKLIAMLLNKNYKYMVTGTDSIEITRRI